MKIYLDDERETPIGYNRCYTSDCVIFYLKHSKNIEEISLDHDLGNEELFGTGYDVLLWIEEQVFINNYIPPKLKVHSANISAKKKMEMCIRTIEKFINKNNIKV